MKPVAEKDVMFSQSVVAAILCRSWRNPITGSALADEFSVDIRRITFVIEAARDAGIKIASSKGGFDKYIGQVVEAGYYQAKGPDEMRSTADMIHGTAMNLLAREKKMMAFPGEETLWQQRDEEAA